MHRANLQASRLRTTAFSERTGRWSGQKSRQEQSTTSLPGGKQPNFSTLECKPIDFKPAARTKNNFLPLS